MSRGWDVLIVGGGAAGCVLAARLSEDGGRRVLLLEAGPDLRTGTPPDIVDGRQPAYSHDWGYTEVAGPGGDVRPLPRGRLLGGCSATNATFALRGHPADYDRWAAAGNGGWSFAEVLDDFVRLEADADWGDRPWHGKMGPLPIRRYTDAELSDVARAGEDLLYGLTGTWLDDLNAPGAVGAGRLPVNCVNGRRISTAVAYLPVDRPNLDVRCDLEVRDLVLRSGRALGVRLRSGQVLHGDAVVLSAGTYGTPALLLRSGVGPADQLRSAGIAPLVDLPGVGQGLVDHPAVSVLLAHPGPTGDAGAKFQVVATARSDDTDSHCPPDLQFYVTGPWPSNGSSICSAVAALLQPHSRGSVRLRTADPADPPLIDLGYFRDESDLDRLTAAFTRLRQACREGDVARISGGLELSPGPHVSSDQATTWVRHHAWTYHHPVGTAAMGADPANGAVVDSAGRVHGVLGLWVVDASVMPGIPSANTHLPTVMVAEHLSARFTG